MIHRLGSSMVISGHIEYKCMTVVSYVSIYIFVFLFEGIGMHT